MKKFVLLLGLMLALQTQTLLMAQVDTSKTVVFNAHLLSTFRLNVVDGPIQTITFADATDYNLGVTGPVGNGIQPGFTTITVEATENWTITIECPDFLPANPGPIPIDNLGVWCQATGLYQFGAEVTCAYLDFPVNALGLSNGPVLLIGLGTGNGGDATDNRFILNWEMGTMENASMHTTSMFDQMAFGTFNTGDYTTTATLTLIPD